MLAIEGIGVFTVAGYLAEICDVRCFKSPRQIQNLAGLSLRKNSSENIRDRQPLVKEVEVSCELYCSMQQSL